jgi:hypothetical protein
MEITEIPISALNEIELFDISILHHGLEEYNRDYYFIIESGTKYPSHEVHANNIG